MKNGLWVLSTLLLAACASRAVAAAPKASPKAAPGVARRMDMLDDVKAALWPERHPKFSPSTAEEREAMAA
ncbi:MAG TPA: hypothetical protein VMV18_01495, partial [bacterium]|nr:hypothetical protein [bacterium]